MTPASTPRKRSRRPVAAARTRLARTLLALAVALVATPAPRALAAAAAPRALARPHRIVHMVGARPATVVTTPHLSYYGGPVVQNAAVAMVLYGTGTFLPNVTGAATPSMAEFYQQFVVSPHMDWLCEYDTNILDVNNLPGTQQRIGRGSWLGTFTITPDSSRNGATITDAQLVAELEAQIDGGHLPLPDSNTVYMVHFPAGKSIELDPFDFSCVQFCGYHGFGVHNGRPLRYGVMPDMSGGCATGCGGATAFGSLTTVAWHELIETITDPDSVLAWYDSQGGEIGDICDPDTLTIVANDGYPYLVQKLWSNVQGTCAITGPSCAPAEVAAGTPGALDFALACANPVFGAARFRLALPTSARVALSIHDVSGRRVGDLLAGTLPAGEHTVSWSPGERAGTLATGVYFARLTVGDLSATRTFIVLR